MPNSETEAMIAVMGTTGTGKSTFIRLLTKDDNIRIGHDLESTTVDVVTSQYFNRRTRVRVTLVDTPGFDDSREGVTDADILEKISNFLQDDGGRKLNGIIYLHRITDPRFSGIAKKNLGLFRELCGDENLDHVRFVTTYWDVVGMKGNDHEATLANSVFKPFLDGGAQLIRHDDGFKSAKEIVLDLARKPPVAIKIQDELNAGMTLGDTSAGAVIVEEMKELQKRHTEEMEELNKELEEAEEENDEDRRDELVEERWKLKERIAVVQKDRRRLATMRMISEKNVGSRASVTYTKSKVVQAQLRGLPATVDFETSFDDVLISEPSLGNVEKCTNQNPPAFHELFEQKIPVGRNYTNPLLFTLQAFYASYAADIRECSNPGCRTYNDLLMSAMPTCTTWPGLQRWALQGAACLCFCVRRHSDSAIARHVTYACDFVDGRRCSSTAEQRFMSYAGKSNFTSWIKQVNTYEVWLLLSWLRGTATGAYSYTPVPRSCFDSDPSICAHDDKAVNQAVSRALAQGLCPRRVWALAMNLPGAEANIPVFIPDKPLHNTDCPSRHKFCSMGPSHRNCTFEVCEISAVNFTNVVQRHRPGCDGNCNKKTFPVHLLDEAANKNRPTAWAIDGDLRPLKRGKRYVAISHVWSDGTGGSGTVNECMYNYFCDIARSLKCQGLWWDAICIPQEKQARAKAINRMHEYYAQAAHTVVHDFCLASAEWVGSDRASFGLVMSNWFTRGWTALELAKSNKVEVLFGAREPPGFVLKNLNADIICYAGGVSALSGYASSGVIRALLDATKHQSKQKLTTNDVLTSLGPRFTSWSRDRAIIAGLFVGVESLADDQHDIYRQVISKIGRIAAEQLFHNRASIEGPYAWFPPNFFDLPPSKKVGMLRITKDGDIVGDWMMISDIPPAVDLEFFWDATHPLTKCRIREAMREFKQLIVLVEMNVNPALRGLLVKVMGGGKPQTNHADESKIDRNEPDEREAETDESGSESDENENETYESESESSESGSKGDENSENDESEGDKKKIVCHYIGPVYFRTPQDVPPITIYARIIGAGGEDLGVDVTAVDFLKSQGVLEDWEPDDQGTSDIDDNDN